MCVCGSDHVSNIDTSDILHKNKQNQHNAYFYVYGSDRSINIDGSDIFLR